jgi:phenylalanyl-tRNA synthetase beta chain
VFTSDGGSVKQVPQACFALTSPNTTTDWPRGSFYHVKGALETILGAYDGRVSYAAEAPDYFHAGRSAVAKFNGRTVATIGEVAASAYGTRKFRQPVYACEIYLEELFAIPLKTARYKPLSRFPAVERDFSLLLPNVVTWEQIETAVAKLAISELGDFQIVEIFRGKSVPQGQYSALLRATLQSPERTLRDEEIAAASERIIAALQALGGTLRAQ